MFLLVTVFSLAEAAPYADMVMDARSGKVLRSRNADTRLHPASLIKMKLPEDIPYTGTIF